MPTALLLAAALAGQPFVIPPVREAHFPRQVARSDSFSCGAASVSLSLVEADGGVTITYLQTPDWTATADDLAALSSGLRRIPRLRALYADCRGFRNLDLVFGGQLNAGGLEEDRRVLRVTPGRPPEWLPREP